MDDGAYRRYRWRLGGALVTPATPTPDDGGTTGGHHGEVQAVGDATFTQNGRTRKVKEWEKLVPAAE